MGSITSSTACPAHVRYSLNSDRIVNIRDLQRWAKNRHRLHSITLSARATSNGGSSIPRVFAVFRLMLNSNLVGWKMGMSAGFGALQDLVNHVGDAVPEFRNIDPVRHQSSGFNERTIDVDCWQTMFRGEFDDQSSMDKVFSLVRHHEFLSALFREG